MYKRGLCRHVVSVRLSVCLSVRPSIRPLRSCILSKRINRSSKKFHRQVAKPFQFFCPKCDGNISTGIPITGASNAVRVGTNRDRRRYGWLSIDDVLDLRATSATIHQSTVYRTDGDASVKYSLQQARPRRREQNRIYLYAAHCIPDS